MAKIVKNEPVEGVENEEVAESTNEAEKTLETAQNEATEGKFIYIGPALPTGVKENAIFYGSREAVEEYLKATIEQYPQTRLLIVSTESLGTSKAKLRTNGTLLNKYYNNVAKTVNKVKED